MLPNSLKYIRSIKVINQQEPDAYLKFIERELVFLDVNSIKIDNFRIDFKNNIFNEQGRWHLMASVNKGFFVLDFKNHKLIYSISMSRMFYIALVFSIFLGVIAYPILGIFPGILFFCWFFGMNCIIAIIRHRNFINKLVQRINKEL